MKTTPDLLTDYDRVIAAFDAVATLPSLTQQRFALMRVATFYGMPKSETRQLYSIWRNESRRGVEV